MVVLAKLPQALELWSLKPLNKPSIQYQTKPTLNRASLNKPNQTDQDNEMKQNQTTKQINPCQNHASLPTTRHAAPSPAHPLSGEPLHKPCKPNQPRKPKPCKPNFKPRSSHPQSEKLLNKPTKAKQTNQIKL